ncbi:BamA/TamA family outer membrane protein [Bdellovibrio sp. HCB290]|uniref:BamA/TamA family outer membrane protein n=1 Tax=Bdellovibrio sp. HCB290 TaxID=3394356 RepID=UPI0039B41CA0
MPLKKSILYVLALILVNGQSAGAEIQSSSNFGSDVNDFEHHEPPMLDPTQKTPLDFQPTAGSDVEADEDTLYKPEPGVKEKKSKGELVLAPVPNYNPSQGWGLALLGQKIFPTSKGVKPSMGIGAVFGTQKKSYGGVLGYVGRLNEDRLRLNVFGGAARINSDFYGTGKDAGVRDQYVLMEQDAAFGSAQLLPQLAEGFFLGVTLGYSKMKTSFEFDQLPPEVSNRTITDENWLPGFKGQYDSRNNSFYPTTGIYSNFQGQFFDKNFGGDHTFQRYKVSYNQYFTVFSEDVIAVRAATEANIGDVPFYNMAVFGQGQDMRGYKAGQYRDNILWAAQSEYRHRFAAHWGYVVFGGFGDVIGKVSEFTLTDLLWAGGAGIRYRLGRENPVDFRVDVAYGDDWVGYFSVNQAF